MTPTFLVGAVASMALSCAIGVMAVDYFERRLTGRRPLAMAAIGGASLMLLVITR